MVMTPPAARFVRTTPASSSQNAQARSAAADPHQIAILTYDIAALTPDGKVHYGTVKVPEQPFFQAAFTAFARGTVIRTPNGAVAIEDLQPGDPVAIQDGGVATVKWIGSGACRPTQANPLVRILPQSFGPARPDVFVTLGPGAQISHCSPHDRAEQPDQRPLRPAKEFVDGVHIIQITPPTPVTLYHLVLDQHAIIQAGGLECESFHPCVDTFQAMSHGLQGHFLRLFPHISKLSDFGPIAAPRTSLKPAG
ncbi:MAG: Hint domain-containing protein [Paracoccaceae bacterium]